MSVSLQTKLHDYQLMSNASLVSVRIKIDHSIRPSYHFTTILNDKDASKPVARHLNLPNHSKQHVAVCGLSLHQGSSESRKTLSNPHGINERFLFN